VPEINHGRAAFSVAAFVVAATRTVTVGIGVVNPFWRHPSVIAMEAATLAEASGGRFRIGLGAALWSLRTLGEADERTRRPLTATVEAARVVRALLRAEDGVDGVVNTVRHDARLDLPVPHPVPVYLGPVNRRMLAAAGAWADGVELGALVSTGYARWAWPVIAQGAVDAGRDPAALDLAAPITVSLDGDHRRARASVRRELAAYLHRVEPVMFEHAGADHERIEAVRLAVSTGGPEAGVPLIDDGLIDTFTAAGDPEHVAARFDDLAAAGVRGLLATLAPSPDPHHAVELLAQEVLPRVTHLTA